MERDSDDHFLYAVATASAFFGLLQAWLMMDIDKSPVEPAAILKRVIRKNLLFCQRIRQPD